MSRYRTLNRWLRSSVLCALVAGFALTAFGQVKEGPAVESAKPTITITSVPSDPPGDRLAESPIEGKVTGINPKDYKIVIYAYGDRWYVQPWAASPFTDIEADGSWKSETHGGTEFAVLLVKPSYKPPATTHTLPKVGGDIVAIEKKKPSK